MPLPLLVVTAALCSAATIHAAEVVAPYVQTVQDDVERLLDLAEVQPGDYLMDLGSGDGRIVITAAARGAMGLGVELDGDLVDLARRRARSRGVEERAAFVEGDIFAADISRATVVTLYLMPEVNLRLRPKLLAELRPGTRVLSNSFDMGDWAADRHISARSSGGLLLWIVPADVTGTWRVEMPGRVMMLSVAQQFQQIHAIVTDGTTSVDASEAMLRGDRITFSAVGETARYVFSGRVDDDRITGMVHIHDGRATTAAPWTAHRSGQTTP
jgi:SAM-dependent methyltransferase